MLVSCSFLSHQSIQIISECPGPLKTSHLLSQPLFFLPKLSQAWWMSRSGLPSKLTPRTFHGPPPKGTSAASMSVVAPHTKDQAPLQVRPPKTHTNSLDGAKSSSAPRTPRKCWIHSLGFKATTERHHGPSLGTNKPTRQSACVCVCVCVRDKTTSTKNTLLTEQCRCAD